MALRATGRTLLVLIALVFAVTASLWVPQMASAQPQETTTPTELPYDLQPPGDSGNDDGGGIGPGPEGAPDGSGSEGGGSEGGGSGGGSEGGGSEGDGSGGDGSGSGDSQGEGSEGDDGGGGLGGLLDWGEEKESCDEQSGSTSYTDQFITLNEDSDLSYTVCPTDNYYLHYLVPEGSEAGLLNPGQITENGWNGALNGFASFAFVMLAKFVQFAIEATKFVLEFSLIEQFSEASQIIASAIGDSIYDDWYPWIIAIMVIYCGYKWFTGDFTEGWKEFAKTLFFLGLASLIIAGGISQNAQKANDLANQFTSMGFFAVAGVTNTIAGEDFTCEEKKPVDCVSRNIWNTYIYDPWKSLQISGSDEQFADEHAEEVLALQASADREEKLKELLEENEEAVAPTVDALRSVSHLASVGFTVFVAGCLILILVLMAIRLVVSELKVAVLVWTSPAWLLAAAVPGARVGTRMGLWLVEELLQVFLWKFLIGVYLIIIVLTLALPIPMGGKAFIILALTVMAFLERQEIQRRIVSASGVLKLRERFGESNRERERHFHRDRRSSDVSPANANSAGLEAGIGTSPSPAGPAGGYGDFGAHGGRVDGGGANGASRNGSGSPTLRSSARKARAGGYTGDAKMLAADEYLSSKAGNAARRSGIPDRMRKSAGRMADTQTATDARRAQAMELKELARKRAMNPQSLTNNERKRLAQADRLSRQGKNPLKDTNLVAAQMEAVRNRRAQGVSPGEHLAGAMRDGETEEQYAERVRQAEAEADGQAQRLQEDARGRRAVGYDHAEQLHEEGEQSPGGGHDRREEGGDDDPGYGPGYGGEGPSFTGDGSGSGEDGAAGGATEDGAGEYGSAEDDVGADAQEQHAGAGAGRRTRFPEEPPFEMPENSEYFQPTGVVTGFASSVDNVPEPPEGSGYELHSEGVRQVGAQRYGQLADRSSAWRYRWKPTAPAGVQMPEGATYNPDTGVVSGEFNPSSEQAPTPPEGYVGHSEAQAPSDPSAESSAIWRWTPDGKADVGVSGHSGPQPTETGAEQAGADDDPSASTGAAAPQPDTPVDTAGDGQVPEGVETQRSGLGRAWDNYRGAEESAKAEGRAVLLDDAKSGKVFLAPQATTLDTMKATGGSLASNLASNFGGSGEAGARADTGDTDVSAGAHASVGGDTPASADPGNAPPPEVPADDPTAGGSTASADGSHESPADTGTQSPNASQQTGTRAGFDTQTPVTGTPVTGTPDTGVSGTGVPEAEGSTTTGAAAEPLDADPGAGTAQTSDPSEGAQPSTAEHTPQPDASASPGERPPRESSPRESSPREPSPWPSTSGTPSAEPGALDTGTLDTAGGEPGSSSNEPPPPATQDAESSQISVPSDGNPSDEAQSSSANPGVQPSDPSASSERPAQPSTPDAGSTDTGASTPNAAAPRDSDAGRPVDYGGEEDGATSRSPRARNRPSSPRSGGRSAAQDFGLQTPSDPSGEAQEQPDGPRKLESQRSRARRRPGKGRGGRP